MVSKTPCCDPWKKTQITSHLAPLLRWRMKNSEMLIQLLNLTALLHKFQHNSIIYPIIKKKSNYVLIIFDTILLLVVINWKSLHHFMLNSKMNDIFQLLACLMLLNCFRSKVYSWSFALLRWLCARQAQNACQSCIIKLWFLVN